MVQVVKIVWGFAFCAFVSTGVLSVGIGDTVIITYTTMSFTRFTDSVIFRTIVFDNTFWGTFSYSWEL